MKTLLLLISLLVLPKESWAQTILASQEKFMGHWEDKGWLDNNVSCDYLIVEKDTATFYLLDDMLHLTCRPTYKDDTLLLYVINYHYNDVSSIDGLILPERNSLFAKCYLKEEQIHIIYTLRSFMKSAKGFDFDSVLYNFIPVPISTEQKKFNGEWYDISDQNLAFPVLEIKGGCVLFQVIINQLDLTCVSKYQNDTLLLYIKNRDCGRLFFPGNYPPPKTKSLFAKCYLKGNRLHVIYTQKIVY